jgi:hypothetical protein
MKTSAQILITLRNYAGTHDAAMVRDELPVRHALGPMQADNFRVYSPGSLCDLTLQHSRLIPITVVIVLCLLAPSCSRTGQVSNLHDRIVAAHTSQYYHPPDACYNPNVLVVETGYDVTTFVGSRSQHANVPPMEIAKYLASLPMQVWPRGPLIEITPTDDVTDQGTLYRNFNAAQQIFHSMGLEVQVRPGG